MTVTTPPPEKPVASERQIHSSVLATAWVLVAILGAASISALSGQGSLRLLAPLAIMLAYLYFGLNSPGRNTAKLADSVYFLGFLWTLYALINEFIFRRSSVSNADSVYRVFGYALVTTAFGLFVRLALLQFQQTASDQMEEARDDLDIRLESFARELTRSQEQLASWRGASKDSMASFDEELRHLSKSLRTRIEAVHVDAAVALSDKVKEAVLLLVEELKNVTPLTRKMRTSVSTLEKATTAAAEGLMQTSALFAEKLTASVNMVSTALAVNLERAGKTLETATTDYAATIAKQRDSVVGSLNTTADASRKLLQVLTELQATATTLAVQANTVKENIGGLARTVAETTVSMGQIRTAGVESVQKVIDEAATAASTAKDTAVALNKTVDDVLDFTRRRLG